MVGFQEDPCLLLRVFRRLTFGRAVAVGAGGFERGPGGPIAVLTFGACFSAVYFGV